MERLKNIGKINAKNSDVKFTSYFSTMDMIEACHGLVDEKKSYLDYGYFGILRTDFDENGISTGNYTPKPSYKAVTGADFYICGGMFSM